MPIRIQHDKAASTCDPVCLGTSARGCAPVAMSPESHNRGKGFGKEVCGTGRRQANHDRRQSLCDILHSASHVAAWAPEKLQPNPNGGALMTSGLSRFTRPFVLCSAVAMLVGSGAVAHADGIPRGGSCCADLEERIAELEATTARKGNRRVSLTISGQVTTAVMAWDAGSAGGPFLIQSLATQPSKATTFTSRTGRLQAARTCRSPGRPRSLPA